MTRWNFYKKNFLSYIEKDAKILLISGSDTEIQILKELGYSKIYNTFFDKNESNEKIFKENNLVLNQNLFNADARNLKFKSNSFDYVVTNATLHHIDLPHQAVTEMYRVANKGVLIIESNDSIIMNLACKLNLAEEFEISSVKDNSGGLLNKGIPNYVYRWTEREIFKLLNSYNPEKIHKVKFNYANDLTNIKFKKKILNILFKLIIFCAKIFFLFFKKQQNCLSIFINKLESEDRWKK